MVKVSNEFYLGDIELSPAYGFKCRTQSELQDAWLSGKDFFSPETRYCSIRDIDILRRLGRRITLTNNFYEYIVI